jgi:membrane-associated phospholipid phosphatase
LAAILLAGGILALLVDVPFAKLIEHHPLPKDIDRIFQFSEIGGHGTGAAMILVAALSCSKLNWRRHWDRLFALRLIGGTYLGSLMVALLKALIPRVRPRVAELESADHAIDTFGRQLLEAGDHSRAALMSFASGHAAVAAGLGASLCWFYPGGRPAWVALAILAGLQRTSSSNHYLSDVFVGASLGLLGAWICMPKEEPQALPKDSGDPRSSAD